MGGACGERRATIGHRKLARRVDQLCLHQAWRLRKPLLQQRLLDDLSSVASLKSCYPGALEDEIVGHGHEFGIARHGLAQLLLGQQPSCNTTTHLLVIAAHKDDQQHKEDQEESRPAHAPAQRGRACPRAARVEVLGSHLRDGDVKLAEGRVASKVEGGVVCKVHPG